FWAKCTKMRCHQNRLMCSATRKTCVE
ncbi:adenylate cyclase, class-I family protein, partial [Vibrio parahaemolyticus V-223/04]